MIKKIKKPWPTKDVMNQIYDMHLWGGIDFDFYSGFGSHEDNIVKPYLEVVIDFLKSFDEAFVVCDLGCGDFNIGRQLLQYTQNYIAIDIVEKLIKRNKTLFKAENLEFHCLDISKEELPKADCVILRNVLQHLSNAEIKNVVDKLSHYKYILLTEHIPFGNFEPNKDIISGQSIRLKRNSGVDLIKTPFNLKIKDHKILDEHILNDKKGQIVTTLYKVF